MRLQIFTRKADLFSAIDKRQAVQCTNLQPTTDKIQRINNAAIEGKLEVQTITLSLHPLFNRQHNHKPAFIVLLLLLLERKSSPSLPFGLLYP